MARSKCNDEMIKQYRYTLQPPTYIVLTCGGAQSAKTVEVLS
jgi:hypothetical protein